MSRQDRLRKLLKHPHVWRSGQAVQLGKGFIPTGFSALDQSLGGGWPVGVLTEILLNEQGFGELRLLMPALALLGGQQAFAVAHAGAAISNCQICWIAPPYLPYAPALAQHGLDLSQVLIVHADKAVDVLWSVEQALRSAACLAVLAWVSKVDDRALRRLQLAAETGTCWTVIFRPAHFLQQPSPAPLRIGIEPAESGLQLNILRNRYGPVTSLSLPC